MGRAKRRPYSTATRRTSKLPRPRRPVRPSFLRRQMRVRRRWGVFPGLRSRGLETFHRQGKS